MQKASPSVLAVRALILLATCIVGSPALELPPVDRSQLAGLHGQTALLAGSRIIIEGQTYVSQNLATAAEL